jgi:hypothetical protein
VRGDLPSMKAQAAAFLADVAANRILARLESRIGSRV